MPKHVRKDEAKTIDQYSNTVYRLAYAIVQNKIDADDVYQDVFLRYVKRQPTFNDDEHEKAWFIKVTTNCAKSFVSSPFRKKTQRFVETKDSYHMDEQSLQLRELVSCLEPKYRLIIHLYYFEDMSIAKMSKTLSIKQSTIRSQLLRARNKLQKIIKGDGYEF